MYKRNEEVQECFENDSWYGVTDQTEISSSLLYNPNDEAMETLAALKPELFVYDKPFLLSADRTILYGFAVSNETVLEIPSTVLFYDNLFIHEETYGYQRIVINERLEEIVNTQNAFGFYVEEYRVHESNNNYFGKNGILFDVEPEQYTQAKLILFPSGWGVSNKDAYVQFPPFGDLIIGEYAFFMRGFIQAIVLPPKTKICKNSFFVQHGCGKIFASSALQFKFNKMIADGRINEIDIEYYL